MLQTIGCYEQKKNHELFKHSQNGFTSLDTSAIEKTIYDSSNKWHRPNIGNSILKEDIVNMISSGIWGSTDFKGMVNVEFGIVTVTGR
jgi:hypothetical protein